MIVKTDEEVKKLQKIGTIVADTLVYMKSMARAGMTTLELDEIGSEFLKKNNAKSAPQLMYNFPGATCISINHHIAHGIPSSNIIKSGDLINIDVSAELDGFFADTGGSFIIDENNDLNMIKLCQATIAAMYAGINSIKAGAKISNIGSAIEKIAKEKNFTIIENLGSHGVGLSLHEEPKFIAPYFDKNDRRILQNGQVITVEPFLSNGAKYAKEDKDGWTLFIEKNKRAAQFEHSIIVTENEPIILTIPSHGRFF
ncbi:type I methionyl aminopeptidase [Pigmentibacter sp. JX0631]|uniref:type I methionyl aminopeptidase n=1 Tax=Pigmentibacter sp. JX0631 TaxID=2976982 RepID=UPI00246876B0|nr:type I methionyl aminopeptidase [Pigmentibacter sp. JX0631]WGL61485.1 type I methionyl aminopeptidase [Pigmentibacter sp. JX0631]